MIRRLTRHSIWSVLISLLSVALVTAQGASCTGLLEEALFAVEGNCEGTGRNEVCYGFNEVSASFVNEVPEDFFTLPSDLSEVADLATLQTAPLDTINDIWGVALMNIQADLPNTLPGQSVTFVLLGDVEVGNTVAPEDTLTPSDGVEVMVNSAAGANIRSGAGLNFNVVGGALEGDTFVADGTSPDGQWFRIVDDGRPAWINASVLDTSGAGIDDLPVLSNQAQTPMQSFYLRTGIGQPECEDAPDDVLLVQGPQDIVVNITVNGANIQMGSTIALRLVEGPNGEPVMQVIAIEGNVVVDGITIPPGQVLTYSIREDANGLPVVEDVISGPDVFDEFTDEFCIIESIPLSLLNYDVNLNCPDDEQETPPLVINPPAVEAPTANACDSFTIISPQRNVNSGNNTFRWQAVAGQNIDYVLVFYNSNGLAVNEFRTANTQYSVNLGSETDTGGEFSWEVRAYRNGSEYLCVTPRSPRLVRTGELNPSVVNVEPQATEPIVIPTEEVILTPEVIPPLSALLTCNTVGEGAVEATISWLNAPELPVTIEYFVGYDSVPTIVTQNAVDGQFTTESDYYGINSINVSSGIESVFLGSCETYYYYYSPY